MLFSRWFSRSSKKGQSRSGLAGRRRTPRQPAVAARIERLEPRLLLTVLNVTTDADVVNDGDGVLSLREAILIANDSTGATTFDAASSTDVADVIVFSDIVFDASTLNILLNGTQLPTILESLRIDGAIDAGSARLTIDASRLSRFFDVDAAATVRLENLVLHDGDSGTESGGAIRNAGSLELINVEIAASISDTSGGGVFNAAGASLTITGGQITRNSALLTGGGLHNDGGALTLDGVRVERNWTGGDGGGLHNSGSGSVSVSNVAIVDNLAEGDGGGVWTSSSGTFSLLGAAIWYNVAHTSGAGLFAGSDTGTLSVADSTISGNFGGGLQIEGGTTTLANSVVSHNSGSDGGIRTSAGTVQLLNVAIADNRNGGGLHNTGATLTLDNVIIDGNHYFGDGGGLHNSGSGSVTGSGVVITNNATGGDGGGIWTSGSGTFSLLGATIASNYAKNGEGAGLFVATGAGTVNITDSTISGNHAGRSSEYTGRTGGGIQTEGGTITLANSTISANHADNGGGIRANGGTLHLLSSTIAANVAEESGGGVDQQGAAVFAQSTMIATNSATASAHDFRGTLQSSGFNLIGNTAGATIAGDTASDITNVDPRLGPLQNNGGPTNTHALLLGSPATNRGFNAAGAAFDQRGTPFTRSFAGATDIGAFELHLSADLFAVGAGPGGGPAVRVFDAATGQRLSSFFAFNPAFRGGVTVAAGDVTGDGFPEIVAGAGPGGGPVVRVFDGLTGAQIGEQILAFPLGFRGGVLVATGDLDGDGDDEIIVGAGPGGGPAVRVFDGTTGAPIGEHFFAFPIGFKGGVTVAAGDLDGDGDDEIIVGAGPGGVPAVRVFDGLTGAPIGERFFAFPLGFTGGVTVAAGDVDGDGDDEIIVGAGPGGGPAVRVFDGLTGAPIGEPIFALPLSFRGGVRVAAVDVNDDRAAEILAGAGPGGGPALRIFDGGTRLPVGDPLFAFDPQFSGGIFVAGHISDPEALVAALRVDHSHASNGGSASDLTESDLSAVVAAAPMRLRQAGVSEETLTRLANVEFAIGDLGGDRLALARPDLILLDDDAAGFGWFVDYSPLLDEEFLEDGSQLASLDGRASGRIDLLTAVLHEMGHALGLGHTEHPADDGALMSSTLPAGIRRLPDSEELDALFAAAEGLDFAAV